MPVPLRPGAPVPDSLAEDPPALAEPPLTLPAPRQVPWAPPVQLPPPWPWPAPTPAPGVPPFNRIAIPMAMNGGNLRSFESPLTFTTTGILVAMSAMVMVIVEVSVETTAPAMSRNQPETMACPVDCVPWAFLAPPPRTWPAG